MVTVLDRLGAICGERYAREAGPVDTVGGVPARWVAAPGSGSGLGEVVAVAAERKLAVVARGAGTKLDWGAAPSRVDILIDTGRLAGLRDRAPGDLTATIGAGTPLRAAQSVLGAAGQRLALDAGSGSATVGGVLSSGEAGPLRFEYGAPRDLLLGVEFARADGVVTRASGKDGYDLGRVLCGSYGTLGLIASATVRVHPLPAARAWVLRTVRTPIEVHGLTGDLLGSTLAPAAIEMDLPADPTAGLPRRATPGTLAVLLEGSPAGVRGRAGAVMSLLGGDARVSLAEPDWWGRPPFGPGEVALKLVAPIADLHAAIYAFRDAAGATLPVRGSAGVGVVYAALPAGMPSARAGAVLAAVRTTLFMRGGSCTVLDGPGRVRAAVDQFGDVPGRDLMRRLKERFDPAGTLAPDRMPG